VALAATTPAREIICPGCGRHRLVSDRNARRKPQTCNLCRHPDKHQPPEDKDRRFWLERFSDEEILHLAFGIFEEEGSLETIHLWRLHLGPEQPLEMSVTLVRQVRKRRRTHDLLHGNGKGQLRERVGGA
jgi:hypothetical protein